MLSLVWFQLYGLGQNTIISWEKNVEIVLLKYKQ